MKKLLAAAGLSAGLSFSATSETIFGGTDTTDVDNWITDSVAFDDTIQSGHSLNWENVITNTATIDSANNEFDLSWETNTNYTIGHMFIYNEAVDLSTLTPLGIENLTITAQFTATGFANWSPVVSVTDGGVTTYYRWNHSGNTWNGSGFLDFSDPPAIGVGPTFDLSGNGNGTEGGAGNTAIFGELNAVSGNFGGTRDNGTQPSLQAATGMVRFGFIQWGASTGGSVSPQADFSTVIESFEVVVNSDPVVVTPPTVTNGPGTGLTPSSFAANGEVTNAGGENPTITIYFGTSDGGEDDLAWDDSVTGGTQGGIFSTTVGALLGTPLDGNTTYFYRAFAENSAGSDWADTTESATTLPFAGLPDTLNSANFDFKYEMDSDPSQQDLDGLAGANDFWIPTAAATGVDQTMWIPQTYVGGHAISNQAGVDPEFVPEALFRTDFGDSVQRQSIFGDFTVEVSINIAEGTQIAPAFDLGGFAMFLNPPGQAAFRLNIDETETSLGQFGDDFVSTGSNTDALHTFRVAYVAADQRYWAWRDDVLIYGGNVNPGGGLAGSEASVYSAGGMLIGDFAFDITGDWEIDYLRIHNAAVAPGSVVIDPTVAITDIDKQSGSPDVTLTFTVDPPQNVEIWKSTTGDGVFTRIAENVGTTTFIDPTGTDDTTLYQVRIP